MKVLVAGGRGFIGAAAVRALAAAGHDAHAIGRGDRIDACDALVWTAGRRHPDDAANLSEHVAAPVAAIAAARPARVVYLSSGEVYGAQAVPFREDAPLLGTSPYARAKIAGERAVAEAAAAVTVLRPAIVYGPGQTGSMFLPSIVAALVRGERFAMTAGEQTRDLVHVGDVAAAIARALDGPAGTYNVASGVEVTLVALARAVAERVGARACDRLEVGALPYRAGEQMRYALDPSRAAAALGWRAIIALAGGLDQIVAAARAT